MLENDLSGLSRAEIECVVRNQYNSFLKQQYDSKALSASKVSTTTNRGNGMDRRSRYKFKGSRFKERLPR